MLGLSFWSPSVPSHGIHLEPVVARSQTVLSQTSNGTHLFQVEVFCACVEVKYNATTSAGTCSFDIRFCWSLCLSCRPFVLNLPSIPRICHAEVSGNLWIAAIDVCHYPRPRSLVGTETFQLVKVPFLHVLCTPRPFCAMKDVTQSIRQCFVQVKANLLMPRSWGFWNTDSPANPQ